MIQSNKISNYDQKRQEKARFWQQNFILKNHRLPLNK